MNSIQPNPVKKVIKRKVKVAKKEEPHNPNIRLYDFHIYNRPVSEKKDFEKDEDEDEDDYDDDDDEEDDEKQWKKMEDKNEFFIQMFGMDQEGQSYSVIVKDYQPFFYIKVDHSWNENKKNRFLLELKKRVKSYYENSIGKCYLLQQKILYGFDGGQQYPFLLLQFKNNIVFNKVKNLWYDPKTRNMLPNGFHFEGTRLELYEANIPPLLRFFHIQNISPSGWISLPYTKATLIHRKQTLCTYEYEISYNDIIPLNEKEDPVPLKICSFDIEASSSHGDFPIPIKTYKKLATNLVDTLAKEPKWTKEMIQEMILYAFGFSPSSSSSSSSSSTLLIGGISLSPLLSSIERVYTKRKLLSKEEILSWFETWYHTTKHITYTQSMLDELKIERLFQKMATNHPKQKTNSKEEDKEKEKEKEEEENEEEGGEEEEDENKKEEIEVEEVTFKKKDEEEKEWDIFVEKLTSCPKEIGAVEQILQNKQMDRMSKINELTLSLNATFPSLEGDKVTFIGSTFRRNTEKEPYYQHCLSLRNCAPVKNVDIEYYDTEKELLLAWTSLIQRENPDGIIGYNTNGFDYEFMFHRAVENDCVESFLTLSKNKKEICGNMDRQTGKYKLEELSLQIASGHYDLKYIKMPGRVQIDLYTHFRRTENLSSYKLDYVSGYFLGDYVQSFTYHEEIGISRLKTINVTGLYVGSFIHLEEIGHSIDYYAQGAKFEIKEIHQIKEIDPKSKKEMLATYIDIASHLQLDMTKKVRWCLAKDDVTPKEIFALANGTAEDRAIIAKYCIQDCNLVHHLMVKTDIWTGFSEMAKLCSVPINFLVLRGQGIKLTSFVAKKCREKGILMPVLDKIESDEGYEGAIVLEPKCDLYLDNPVACVDYASLYPSSMISENICHSSKVWTKEYDLQGILLRETGCKCPKTNTYLYDNLPNHQYVNITYDTFVYKRKTPKAAAKKIKVGYKICRYVQPIEGQRAVMPSILEELLSARKRTRAFAKTIEDEFMQNVLDKRQLAYKLTANSLYGQCGAKTSTFYEKDCAASTTATGRLLLTYAKKIVEECYNDTICDTTRFGQVLTKAEYIYGDTDSVFFTFNLRTPDGIPIKGKEALEITIELAQQAGDLASQFLKQPHDLEYEKTFMPFCLLSKKRYVGMLYEKDINKGKRKEMGIVLKRRDNAPIVKDIFGGIIDILMKQQNIQEAIDFLKLCLQKVVNEQYPMEKLIISRALSSGYKNPTRVPHKVLADRIGARDPGNKPSPGDRIPFVYIHNENKDALQGDKIETPTFIMENKIKIDYSHYITNQIMKPVSQVFALVLEKIWLMQGKHSKMKKFKRDMELLQQETPPEKWKTKMDKIRAKEIQILLFDEFTIQTTNRKQNNQSISSFFKQQPAIKNPSTNPYFEHVPIPTSFTTKQFNPTHNKTNNTTIQSSFSSSSFLNTPLPPIPKKKYHKKNVFI